MNKKLIGVFVLAVILFSCRNSKHIQPEIEAELFTPVFISDLINENHHTLTFLAVGDNLFHEWIINTFRQDDIYDFSPIYSEVKDIIRKADLTFINQETVMAGERFGYSGFPRFNTPQSLAYTLADTGFEIMNLANNHALDMGSAGLYATLDFLDTIDELTVIGARRSGESRRIITRNNITLGFLAYTFSLNGMPIPSNNPNLVSMINRNTMTKEISELRPLCDFLIVSMHWGDEYMLIEPVSSQKELALFLAENNVDLIIGHHPHVLQRVEKLPRPDGKETLCFYSLGNFASNQREKDRVLGAMMLVTFNKESSDSSEDKLYISDSGILPVVCHFEPGFLNTKLYPFYSYTNELMEKHFVRQVIGDKEMSFYYYLSVIYSLETEIYMRDPFIPQPSLPF